MKLARILLACTMLLALVFRTLPDSVFDYFHHHEHAGTDSADQNTVGNFKHLCHIEDWNFESFEVAENQFSSYHISATSSVITTSFNLYETQLVLGIGRAPPLA